ncbi:MAG: sugar acetyltransferase [Bacteroidetes bacterium]|jgi:alginate O-acetyltransferase complex protein AlgI|nr:sugar acetyltransferase [Bacteroidota bacterium]
MIFSSSVFLVYFLPVFLAVYFLAPKRLKNAVLLVASIFFYSYGAPKFIFAILATTTLDFYLVQQMDKASSEQRRKLFLVLSVVLNVGMLFYFKYCNFFVENVNSMLSGMGMKNIGWTEIVLPIGISFYTFESLTYVIDVYRRVHKPLDNFWQYQMYILLFPKLIAGPIVTYHEISGQIKDRSANDTIDNKLDGFYRFCLGLAKKVLIANVIAVKADAVFAMKPEELNASLAWIGALSYTFQIYFDFSGYSDMAIGIGKMIGFKFPENFNNPYTSASITEFWRRWHMTLGNWMRNYLYIPLGGNKVSTPRLYFNLWLVFLASGFWHGAAWTFIIWGIYHGVFLILERMFLLKVYERIGKIPAVLITFFIVVIGWIYFRADSVHYANAMVSRLFSSGWELPPLFLDKEFITIACLAILFSFFTLVPAGKKILNTVYYDPHSKTGHVCLLLVSITLYDLSLASITTSGFNPFIYFRF